MSEKNKVVVEDGSVRAKVSFWHWFEVMVKLLVAAVLLGIIWITISKSNVQNEKGDKSGAVESL